MSSDCGPSDAKMRRVEKSSDPGPSSAISELLALSETTVDGLLSALGRICLDKNLLNIIKLAPVKIVNRNASHSNGGILFSKAFCELQFGEKRFSLGDVFHRGIDLCLEYIEGNLPVSKTDCIVLEKLARYLLADEKMEVDLETLAETELTKLLANHLFGKLSTSPWYIINKKLQIKRKKAQCSCGKEECKLTGEIGDTSIGNGDVWHGTVDIIIKNDLIIDVLCDEDEPDVAGGGSVMEVKQTGATVLSTNPQIVAETIVFSFLQKYRHPERENFLTPCIGVDNTSLLVTIYDAENDVLLESVKVPLIAQDGSMKFSIEAVVVAWLTVNYNFLCTGITDAMKSYKADFFSQAKDKLQIYQSQLKFTNVGVSSKETKELKEDLVITELLLEKQKRINAMQEERFTSKVRVDEN